MGFFGKIFSALKKTKDKISEKLTKLFSRCKIDDEFFEELEEVLISSDISVRTSMDIVEQLRDRVIDEKITENEDVVTAFLANHDDFYTEPLDLPEVFPKNESGMLTLIPGEYDTDGFFICRLRRKA